MLIHWNLTWHLRRCHQDLQSLYIHWLLCTRMDQVFGAHPHFDASSGTGSGRIINWPPPANTHRSDWRWLRKRHILNASLLCPRVENGSIWVWRTDWAMETVPTGHAIGLKPTIWHWDRLWPTDTSKYACHASPNPRAHWFSERRFTKINKITINVFIKKVDYHVERFSSPTAVT